jgi:DNA-binding Lrp family transcriptional regulator
VHRVLVFINTLPNASDLVKKLVTVQGVSEAYNSRGMYDAIAMVQADSFAEIKEIISNRIRSLDSVKSTLTLTILESPQNLS